MIIFWTPYRYEDENRGEWNMMNNRVTRIIANSVGLAAVAALGITVYQLGTSPIKEEAPREQTESTGQEEQKQDTDEQSMVDVGTSQVESENHPLSGDLRYCCGSSKQPDGFRTYPGTSHVCAFQ